MASTESQTDFELVNEASQMHSNSVSIIQAFVSLWQKSSKEVLVYGFVEITRGPNLWSYTNTQRNDKLLWTSVYRYKAKNGECEFRPCLSTSNWLDGVNSIRNQTVQSRLIQTPENTLINCLSQGIY